MWNTFKARVQLGNFPPGPRFLYIHWLWLHSAGMKKKRWYSITVFIFWYNSFAITCKTNPGLRLPCIPWWWERDSQTRDWGLSSDGWAAPLLPPNHSASGTHTSTCEGTSTPYGTSFFLESQPGFPQRDGTESDCSDCAALAHIQKKVIKQWEDDDNLVLVMAAGEQQAWVHRSASQRSGRCRKCSDCGSGNSWLLLNF